MKLSRRALFKASLGAAQLALLSRFYGQARAAPNANSPSKLLCLYVNGGLHWESFFAPFTRAGLAKFIPSPDGGVHPYGYREEQIVNLDGSSLDLDAPGPRRKIRVARYWNPANPFDTTGTNTESGGTQVYRPYGQVWADPTYSLWNRASLLVAADQNTASHDSGKVASMCGVAGATFRAPAIQGVVANALASRFPDRPIPNVVLGGPTPVSLGLPTLSAPTLMQSAGSVDSMLSDRRAAWDGLRTRTDEPNVALDGTALGGTVPLTKVDAAVMKAVQSKRAITTPGTDAYLEQLYDTYKFASRTVARDVLSILEKTVGFEKLQQNPSYPANWTACVGVADSCGAGQSVGPFDFALKLLKSDLVSCVTAQVTSIANFTFDTHMSGGFQTHTGYLRITFESIGRLLAEMSLTPSSTPGKSLLDDTLVYVYSEFGRTFPKVGSDHHPAACAIIAGGTVVGNQMLGGYDETMNGSPMGAPADIIEETGSKATRTTKSQDVVASVAAGFGLEMGKDFFIPGGYGVYDGLYPAS